MLWYFDTSAVNSICDDEDREIIVAGLRATGRAQTSAFAAMELAATTNSARRKELLRLMNRMTDGAEPFVEPNVLLKKHLNDLAAHVHGVSLAVESNDTSWNAIRWPESATDQTAEAARKFLRHISDWFDGIAVRTRETVQNLFRDGLATQQRTPRDTLRYLMAPGRLYHQFVEVGYRNATGQILPPELQPLLASEALVRLYFGMFAYALHQRAVREANCSRHRHAGGVDLSQAVYLPLVDVFVTSDEAQYRALRLLRRVGGTKRGEVLRYRTLRSRLFPLG